MLMQLIMKILVIGNFSSFATTKPIVEMLIGLKNKGIDVEIMSADRGRVIDYLSSSGLKIIKHHPKKKIEPSAIKFIRHYLLEHSPDILFLLNSKSIANGIQAAKNVNVKVVTYRGAAGLYWRDPMSFLTHLNPRVDKVICISHFVERNVRKQMPYMRKKTHVIYYGFDPAWYNTDGSMDLFEYNIPKGAMVVGCIANNRPVKGVKYLIRAFKYLKNPQNVYFLLVGDGMAEELEHEKTRLDFSDHIICPGHIEDLGQFYNSIDIYVQPSLKEGLGKSIVEVMCSAKPVIATRSGGPQEIIENGKSGILVDKKSPRAIADEIENLIENKSFRTKLGQQGLARIKEHFGLEKSVDHYYNFFNSIIQESAMS